MPGETEIGAVVGAEDNTAVPEVELDEFGNPVVDEVVEGNKGEAGDKGNEGETSKIDSSTEKKEDEPPVVAPQDQTAHEIQQLRSMIRAQKRELDALRNGQEAHRKALVDKDIVADGELDTEDADATAAQALRNQQLDVMVEMMELTPQYGDVRDVCTQDNFEDVTERLAAAYVATKGGDPQQVLAAIQQTIWGKTNPYKEMYALIKAHHPKYAAKPAGEPAVKPTEPKPVAPSLSAIPGGDGKATGGWTASRIDNMSEEELSKVPADVYEKYMRGELA